MATVTNKQKQQKVPSKQESPASVFSKKIAVGYAQGTIKALKFAEDGSESIVDRRRTGISGAFENQVKLFAKNGLDPEEVDSFDVFVYAPALGVCGVVQQIALLLGNKYASDNSSYSRSCIHMGLAVLLAKSMGDSKFPPLAANYSSNYNTETSNLVGNVLVNRTLEGFCTAESLDNDNDISDTAALRTFQKFMVDFMEAVRTAVAAKVPKSVSVDSFNSDANYASDHESHILTAADAADFRHALDVLKHATETKMLDQWASEKGFASRKVAEHVLTQHNFLKVLYNTGAIEGVHFGKIDDEFAHLDSEKHVTGYTFCDLTNMDRVHELSMALTLKLESATAEARTTGGKKGGKSTNKTSSDFSRSLAKRFLGYAGLDIDQDGQLISNGKGDENWKALVAGSDGGKCMEFMGFEVSKMNGLKIGEFRTSYHRIFPSFTVTEDMINNVVTDSGIDEQVVVEILLGLMAVNQSALTKKADSKSTKTAEGPEEIRKKVRDILTALLGSNATGKINEYMDKMVTSVASYAPRTIRRT